MLKSFSILYDVHELINSFSPFTAHVAGVEKGAGGLTISVFLGAGVKGG